MAIQKMDRMIYVRVDQTILLAGGDRLPTKESASRIPRAGIGFPTSPAEPNCRLPTGTAGAARESPHTQLRTLSWVLLPLNVKVILDRP